MSFFSINRWRGLTPPSIYKTFFISLVVILLLVVLHLSTENLGSILLTPYELIFLSAIMVSVLLATLSSLNKKYFISPLILYPILIFIILRILPVIFSPLLNLHSAISKTLGLIIGILFFLSIHQFELNRFDKDKILIVIFFSGVIQSFIGISQYIFPYLDLSPFLAPSKGVVYGSFQQVNLYAIWLTTCIVISLYLITTRWFLKLKSMTKVLFFFSVFSMGFVLSLAGSPVGLLGLICGSAIFIFSRRRHLILKKRVFALWFSILVIAVSSGIVYDGLYKVHEVNKPVITSKIEYYMEKRLGSRETLYRTSMAMFIDSPSGHGIGDFASLYPFYEKNVADERKYLLREVGYTIHPHNEILYILAESGIAGGVGLAVLVGGFIFLFKNLGIERGGLYLSFLTPLLIHTQLEYPLYQSTAHWMLFLFLSYLPSSHRIKTIELNFSPLYVKMAKIFSLSISISAIIFLSITFKDYLIMMKHVKLVNDKGIVDLTLLEPAIKNPYLREEAEWLKISALLDYGLRKNDKDILGLVVEWTEKQRKKTPYPLIYVREIKALFGIGRTKEAVELFKEAVSLYPYLSDIFKKK